MSGLIVLPQCCFMCIIQTLKSLGIWREIRLLCARARVCVCVRARARVCVRILARLGGSWRTMFAWGAVIFCAFFDFASAQGSVLVLNGRFPLAPVWWELLAAVLQEMLQSIIDC